MNLSTLRENNNLNPFTFKNQLKFTRQAEQKNMTHNQGGGKKSQQNQFQNMYKNVKEND